MNWDKANILTKLGLVFLVRGLLLFGGVASALYCAAGAIIVRALGEGGQITGMTKVIGLLVGISVYFACLAGREHVTERYLIKLFTPPAPPEEK